MSVRSAVRAVVVSALALATVPALVPGAANAATTAVNCPGDDLQTAINAASAGDTLDVAGTCIGNFTINKDLTLQGDGSTALDGNHTGTTVTVTSGVNVGISDLTVTGGTGTQFGADAVGGGIYNNGGTLTLQDSKVIGNSANSSDIGIGGGIDNAGTMTLQDSTVSGNSVTGGASGFAAGGGIYDIPAGTLTMQDSTVSGNTVTGSGVDADGGGIFTGGTMTLRDSTVSGNTANGTIHGFGGGIYNNGGTLTLQDSTVSGNSATGSDLADGGGIESPGSSSASVTATIVSGNSLSAATTFGPDCSNGVPFTSGGYNLIGNTADCSGFVATDRVGTAVAPIDAKLDSLQNNGGPTQTIGLRPGSPAIGAIPLSGGGACLVGQATDQRGVPRPQGKGCDIGAVEKGRTTTGVASSVNPSTLGQSVTFTATVCANPSSLPATPTGTVHFRDGGTGPFLGSPVALAPGGGTRCAQAQLTTSALPVGRGKILGIYSGDGVNNKSRGGVLHKVKA